LTRPTSGAPLRLPALLAILAMRPLPCGVCSINAWEAIRLNVLRWPASLCD